MLTESSHAPGQPAATLGPSAAHTPVRQSSQLQRRSPGGGSQAAAAGPGSPGAAPSSPRDVRAAAAAAAALGAAAPAITSYFCMALLVDPATTAAGAAASGSKPGSPAGTAERARPHVALWARHAGPLLLHKQQRRVAAPVLWLLTASVDDIADGHSCRVLMHLHAVRGLSAIVMSAGYGGSLSSTSGGSSSTRPAAVLWGQHSWQLPIVAGGTSTALHLLQQLRCWVTDEDGYPLLHAFTSSGHSASASVADSGSGRLLMAGRTFATVQEEGPLSMQVG